MANYKVLDQDERDDIIVGFLWTQEKDKYCHQLNLSRYDKLLKSLSDGKWKEKVKELRKETVDRLAEVESIIQATKSQLPNQQRIDAAKERLKKVAEHV